MNILSIIPARAGSKGIPNKNIRIVAGRPLIYYAIKNAMASKYISRIIVSTDSPEVRIIATQMGVECRLRDESLCGDDITLDEVVADAVPPGTTWDYIITMQPTSPTLKSKSLDKAIEYAISNKLDTLISVINEPRLIWGENNGKKVPNYAKRLNRQYLPPMYNETGAFVISKANVVTNTNRIGEKVSVYELSEDEAIDVDTFTDLRAVASIIESHKIAIYVNGNNSRGIGHIYRVLELADEFFVKPDIYYDVNQTDPDFFGKTTHNLLPINSISELFEQCKNIGYDIFINDILSTSIDYMLGLRACMPNVKIVNFEDDGEGAVKADLVFNALYGTGEFPYLYAGEKYYIQGKTFMFYNPIKINQEVRNIFISFGGADPQNYSDRVLRIVSNDAYKNYQFIVVLGKAKHNIDELMKYNSLHNIDVLFDVDNMPELMSCCDIGFTSRGRTAYELAMLGIPTMAMSQNAREEKHGFVCEDNGFVYLGLNPPDEILEANLQMMINMSIESRCRIQDMLLSHDLRNGRKRVMNLINAL